LRLRVECTLFVIYGIYPQPVVGFYWVIHYSSLLLPPQNCSGNSSFKLHVSCCLIVMMHACTYFTEGPGGSMSYISDKTLQLLFFSGFSSSYFPLMQTKVSISCKVQQKLQIFFPCSIYNLNVVTKCECFICNTKFSSDILQGSNSYKFDDNHTAL
jgi:hypothetical protein